MTKEIPLQNGMVALVDDEDYERCMEHVWTLQNHGKSYITVVSNIDGKNVALQSFIANEKEDMCLSFGNKNTLDFRRVNIVFRSRKSMARNSKGERGSTSKYKGVCLVKRSNKWIAYISIDGIRRHLGTFNNEEDAAKAYNSAAQQFWGEDCYLNVIGEDNNSSNIETEKALGFRRVGGTSSLFRGVSFQKRDNNWASMIGSNGKQIRIGSFSSEIEAAKAYDKKAIELHGDKAILNFPDEDGTKI